jgi:alkylation response protein AidB-like acyl-CoA dehydrogenase
MDFDLSEEQQELDTAIRRFAVKAVAPGAAAREKAGEFSHEAWKLLCEMGLPGLVLPKEYGGSSASAVDAVVAMIAMAAASDDFSLTGVWLTHMLLSAMPIATLGTDQQKENYLPAMARGEKIGALALTEPGAGSDLTSLQTTATRSGDHYVLNGSKTFISNASIADVLVVLATVDRDLRSNGLTMFIVDRACPGLSTPPPLSKYECHSWPTGEVYFEDCRVPVTNRLGEEGKGMQYMLNALLWERLAFAPYIGLMEANLRKSIDYARERVQFGKPIAEFELVQAMLAEMRIDLDASRLLAFKLARDMDLKRPVGLQAAVAKTFITEAADRNARKAVQVFGGNGCMTEYQVGRSLWIAKMGMIGGGTSQIQRVVIGKMLAGGA